ncbi:MAG: hypothetical protein ACR2L8_11600 [Solirubrobacteraceae bacterium]
MRIGVAAVPGCFDSGLIVLLDVLRAAERLRRTVDPSIEPIGVHLFASAEKVTTAGGITLATEQRVGDDAVLATLDVLVVAGPGRNHGCGAGRSAGVRSGPAAAPLARPNRRSSCARGGLHRHVRPG